MQLLATAARRTATGIAVTAALGISLSAAVPDKSKPTISVRASPAVGISPARIVLTAELKGGADDYEEFYCATVEWDWGDDTRSESKADCEPYEPGKSEIRRRFTTEHVFNTFGEYRVQFRLKQKNKVVAKGTAEVRVRPGLRDGGDGWPD